MVADVAEPCGQDVAGLAGLSWRCRLRRLPRLLVRALEFAFELQGLSEE